MYQSNSLVLASFNETCSTNTSCTYPLICSSNTNRCICSKSSSVWDQEKQDCFYCPSDWIEWENHHCLSLSVPSQGGISYKQANETCRLFSSELFYIHNFDQFKQFEIKINNLFQSTYSNPITLFFYLGAWIDKYNRKFFVIRKLLISKVESGQSQIILGEFEIDLNSILDGNMCYFYKLVQGINDIWCDENEANQNVGCLSIRRRSVTNNSLCLIRIKCDEKLPFICDCMLRKKNFLIFYLYRL